MGKNAKKRLRNQERARAIRNAYVNRSTPVASTEERSGIPAVDGTHRTGKRHRGTSVLKLAPKMTTRLGRIDIVDSDGRIIAERATLVSSSQRILPDAIPGNPWQGTTGTYDVREQSPHVRETAKPDAVSLFRSVVNRELSKTVVPNRSRPADAVLPTYAKVKPLPTDKWGRG
jgi:hypothetical protein